MTKTDLKVLSKIRHFVRYIKGAEMSIRVGYVYAECDECGARSDEVQEIHMKGFNKQAKTNIILQHHLCKRCVKVLDNIYWEVKFCE